MLTVVAINWQNYQDRGAEYVDKLQRSVARNLTIPHEFVCLTEKELGTDLRGWWAKMKLGEPGRFHGTVMYLDLDVIITANIDHIVELARTDTSKLWMRDDFSYSIRKPRKDLGPDAIRLLGGPGCCNSSVMIWHDDAGWWADWVMNGREYREAMHGDQNAISHIMRERIAYLPDDSIQSYKYGIRNGEKPSPLVVMHGKPKPHDLREPLSVQHWS